MISPETIALVKERTDIVALIGETVRLTRRGRSFTGLCPFHKEKTPSFHVNPERGFFHCFGCKKSGSAVDFMMEVDGHTFAEAIRALAERAGIDVVETATDAERREANAARRDRDELYAVNHLAATFFEHQLRGGPGMPAHQLARYAREELAKRGLPLPIPGDGDGDGDALSPIADALQAFRIGYAPFGWDGLTSFLRQQGKRLTDAEKVGVIVPRSSGSGFYDRFRHRLMFAVTDVTGRVIAFSGRALPDPTPEELTALGIHGPAPAADGASPAKYINSPESPIYTKGEHLFGLHQARHAIRQEGKAILVEGNFDVVSLHARGVGNVVAPLGTAFTTEQAKLLKRFAPDVVVLFDGDAAGRKATRASRKPCIEGQLTAKVAMLPSGLDPDELVRTRGVEALRHLLTHARGLPEQLIDDTIDKLRFAEAPASEQLRRVRAVQELIGEEPEKVVRESLISYAIGVLAKLPVGGRAPTEQSLQATLRLLETANPRHTGPQGPQLRVSETLEPYERARSKPRVEDLGLRILGTLLELPELLNDPEVSDALSVIEGDAALAIAALRQHLILRKGLYADEFLAQIPAPIHSFAAERLASSVFESGGDAKAELLINARKLRALSLSREKSAAVEQLSRVQRLGDVEAENALLREVERAARERRGMA